MSWGRVGLAGSPKVFSWRSPLPVRSLCQGVVPVWWWVLLLPPPYPWWLRLGLFANTRRCRLSLRRYGNSKWSAQWRHLPHSHIPLCPRSVLEVRVGPTKMILPRGHPPHILLGNGTMLVTAAIMQVTHILKLVTSERVTAVIRHGDIHPLIRRRVDFPSQVKSLHHLQVVRRPRVMGCILFSSACIFCRRGSRGRKSGGVCGICFCALAVWGGGERTIQARPHYLA